MGQRHGCRPQRRQRRDLPFPFVVVLPPRKGLTQMELTPLPVDLEAIDLERAIQKTLAQLGPDERGPGGDPPRCLT